MIVKRLKERVLISFWYYFFLNMVRRFRFCGRSLSYVTSRYHNAFLTERTAEIPVVLSLLEPRKNERILEVGNVLSHYVPVRHDVIDKYENAPGIINKDVVEFVPTAPYDTVVCISTLEHIGWDEDPSDTIRIYIEKKDPGDVLKNIDPAKIISTIDLLKKIVRAGGRIIFSVPLGYNPHLDAMLATGAIAMSKKFCLMRVSGNNKWIETTWDNILNKEYNNPYRCANGLLVGVIRC
jgi:hypothetical protein